MNMRRSGFPRRPLNRPGFPAKQPDFDWEAPNGGLGPLIIGLGPGFVAGASVDLAVATNRGNRLGVVI